MKTNAVNMTEREFALPGNRACPGCALSLAYRHILKALEGQVIVTVPASCLTVIKGMYPLTSFNVPCVNTPFAAAAASATGLVAGLKVLGKTGLTVLAIAGDGGTHDIGIQALSGAAERQTDFIYICYDNEGYMNTGNQRSGSTPPGAISGTTPILGKRHNQKDIGAIMEAHGIPYVATANAAYPLDLYEKVRKAKEIKGTRAQILDTRKYLNQHARSWKTRESYRQLLTCCLSCHSIRDSKNVMLKKEQRSLMGIQRIWRSFQTY